MPDIDGIPYVEPGDLVSGYPSVSQSLAQEVSDQLASKIDAAGGEATNLSINTVGLDSTAALRIEADAGNNRNIVFRTGEGLRWRIRVDSTAESGGDVGSNFRIERFDDSGNLLRDDAFEIARGNGRVAMEGVGSNTTANAGNVNTTLAGILRRSTSSIKYKTDVEDLETDYADLVLQLRPVWFRSTANGDAEHPDWSYYGLIAEEVADIDPRLVHFAENDDGTLEPEGVQYDRLVPHLVSLVQRQQAQIDDLTARLDAAGL